MKTKWIISFVLSAVMVAAAVSAGLSIREHMAEQLPHQQSYLVEDQINDQQKQLIDELEKNKAEAVYEAQNKVVQIETPVGSIGSGFLYTTGGDVITNAHVVANTEEVTVISAQAVPYTGRVIGISETEDIAVVRVEELSGIEPLEVEMEKKADLKDPVLALGSPLGFQNTVMTGEITDTRQSFKIDPFHYNEVDQITAPISPGNSGGPLLHAETLKVIGITSAEEPQKDVGYSIPIQDVVDQLEHWIEEPLEELPVFSQYAAQAGDLPFPSKEEQALYLIEYFYSSLQFGDYVTAYSIMSSAYKSENRYEDFRNEFLSVSSLSLEAAEVFDVSEEIKVNATVEYEVFEDDQLVTNTEVYEIMVGRENNHLKIKQLSRN
ncbi:S1C family serine protease [Jeotgalibacillus proteolyticus]|uniref:Serine protease n=1 Tax=Jeotgalibacillus proteolyticus TaxID=2082395 RepID=A0A2S5GC80_9BACL|nr:S1C family serine protease [Jeotgalibacillus proteolyticus]PPA70647.1 serine protease [Jeotgalibacillus proteolyticus]